MTRLLNTPIIGRSAEPVASSCSDMLAGLSKNEIFRMPPDFCAAAGPVTAPITASAIDNAQALAQPQTCRLIVFLPFL